MTKWWLTHAVHGRKPWDVQAEALRRSEGKARYGYFLEQGLGKTSLTLNDFVDAFQREKVDCALVIAPNSFKLDWPLAPEEWGVNANVGYWPKHKLPIDYRGDLPSLYAINYEAVRTGARSQVAELMRRRKVFMIIDESGEIKNPQSQTAKAVLEVSKDATMVRELNGTPIIQNVMDYYMQLRVLGELNGVNSFQFRNRHATMGGYMGKVIQRGEEKIQNKDELYRILNRSSFRALKKDWRDLPPQVQVPVNLEMTPKQRKHFEDMMEDFYTAVNGLEVEAPIVLTQMDKLRQISSGLIMHGEDHQWIEPPNRNPKVRALLDLIDGGDTKMIVVYKYRASGDMLAEVLADHKYGYSVLRGGIRPEQIIENKNRFNGDSSCRIILCQQGASYRGHTLIGGEGRDRCNRMVFYEHEFSYYQWSQMKDRNHRGDQDLECTYWDLITSWMDKYVIDTVKAKEEQASMVDAVVAAVRGRRWKK